MIRDGLAPAARLVVHGNKNFLGGITPLERTERVDRSAQVEARKVTMHACHGALLKQTAQPKVSTNYGLPPSLTLFRRHLSWSGGCRLRGSGERSRLVGRGAVPGGPHPLASSFSHVPAALLLLRKAR